MRKALSAVGALCRPLVSTTLFTAIVAVSATVVLGMATSSSARAEGTEDWSSVYFSKSTKVASLGTDFGDDEAPVRKSRRSTASRASSTKLASLGNDVPVRRQSQPVTGGGVRWIASSGCLNGTLISAVQSIAASFGAVTVNSTCRSAGHNRAVGGAPRSQHLSGDAVDFRVHGNWGGAYAALRSNGSLGGIKHYGGGLFHIDTGPRRSW